MKVPAPNVLVLKRRHVRSSAAVNGIANCGLRAAGVPLAAGLRAIAYAELLRWIATWTHAHVRSVKIYKL
jgi:hypothetical protein